MNILNRILLVLWLLSTLVVVTLVAAAPAEMMAIASLFVGGLKSIADRLLPAGRALVALFGFGLDLVLLLLLWLEIRRPSHRTVRVLHTDGAAAEVTTQTLKERLVIAVDGLPDVVSASARVRSFGRSVEVAVEAEIRPGVQVAEKAEQIAATVREVTETTMGLALRGKPQVRIKAIRLPAVPVATPEERFVPATALPVPPAKPGLLVEASAVEASAVEASVEMPEAPAKPAGVQPGQAPSKEAEPEPVTAEPSR
jgi:hypothetical protein